jgi:hypothetical protein
MRGLWLNKHGVDGVNEVTGGKVENPISRAIIAAPNKHTAERFVG